MTPTSQIVGTQAVINVLTGERYKSITKETAGVLKGEYGATPASVNAELQARVLEGGQAITCRPADLLQDELDHLTKELLEKAQVEKITLADAKVDDVLTYALFPQVGLKFLKIAIIQRRLNLRRAKSPLRWLPPLRAPNLQQVSRATV